MRSDKHKKGYLVRLERGEPVVETLTQFSKDRGIKAATLFGIGACESAEIGYYSLEEKQYYFRSFEGPLEVAILSGNIALVSDREFLHIHVVLGDRNQHALAGHLKEGVVGATLEVRIDELDVPLIRERDDEIGLNLWNVGEGVSKGR